MEQREDDGRHKWRLLEKACTSINATRTVFPIATGEDLRLSSESREAVRVRREGLGEHHQRIVALQPRVMRSPDFPHTARANQGGDFLGAEAAAGANGHVRQILHGFRRRDALAEQRQGLCEWRLAGYRLGPPICPA